MKAVLVFIFGYIYIVSLISGWQPQRTAGPVMLDSIHYYMSDRKAAEEYFIEHFGARILRQPGPMPLEFVTFLSLGPGEGAINISPQGPFPGIRVNDPNGSMRSVIPPAEDMPPIYGVYWLGIRTPLLNQTLTRLEIEGVRVTQRTLSLPHDILARAAMIEGPDFNGIALVERKIKHRESMSDKPAWGDFGIDHLMLLVKDVKVNEAFFRDVYAGRVTNRRPHLTTMRVADATIVLAEPEALGLKRESVQPRNPKIFRFSVDHIGFLYSDVRSAVEFAKAKGYRFIQDGVRMSYYDKPTVYTIAITHSPDGLRCEMVQEDGRIGPRMK